MTATYSYRLVPNLIRAKVSDNLACLLCSHGNRDFVNGVLVPAFINQNVLGEMTDGECANGLLIKPVLTVFCNNAINIRHWIRQAAMFL